MQLVERYQCLPRPGMPGVFLRAYPSAGGGPVVSDVSPAYGTYVGRQAVTITGTGFTGATGATVGGVALTSFLVVDGTTITGVTGAHAAGLVDVQVDAGTPLTSGYEYRSPASILGAIYVDHLDSLINVTSASGSATAWGGVNGVLALAQVGAACGYLADGSNFGAQTVVKSTSTATMSATGTVLFASGSRPWVGSVIRADGSDGELLRMESVDYGSIYMTPSFGTLYTLWLANATGGTVSGAASDASPHQIQNYIRADDAGVQVVDGASATTAGLGTLTADVNLFQLGTGQDVYTRGHLFCSQAPTGTPLTQILEWMDQSWPL